MKHRLVILGTASNVGKSTIVSGLCRYFTKIGLDVVPFKALNISLNSGVSEEGKEMGRAQVIQAEACKKAPSVAMNPVLVKPSGKAGLQIMLNGEIFKTVSSKEYHDSMPYLLQSSLKSLNSLEKSCELVIIEGSGSCCELNNLGKDIANFPLAEAIQSPVILVASIENGGVFASVYGTLQLLPPNYRKLVKGVIINQFRGNPEYFKEGLAILQSKINVPILGVFPHLDFALEAEDGSDVQSHFCVNPIIRIAIVRFPHLANFTDFEPLKKLEGVEFVYVDRFQELKGYHLVILPGTKNTIQDFMSLQEANFGLRLHQYLASGGKVLGICGGYQMLGEKIFDPDHVDSLNNVCTTFGLLPFSTTMSCTKITENIEVIVDKNLQRLRGYEIHMGISTYDKKTIPWMKKENQEFVGIYNAENNVYGTYLHGLFHNIEFTIDFLEKMTSIRVFQKETIDVFEKLSLQIETYLDVEKIALIIEEGI